MKWVTVNGRHIPYDDEDEGKKDRQIDFNKKQADKLNSSKGSGSGKKLGLSKLDKLNNRKSKEKKK